jgi:hypothetical protein
VVYDVPPGRSTVFVHTVTSVFGAQGMSIGIDRQRPVQRLVNRFIVALKPSYSIPHLCIRSTNLLAPLLDPKLPCEPKHSPSVCRRPARSTAYNSIG